MRLMGAEVGLCVTVCVMLPSAERADRTAAGRGSRGGGGPCEALEVLYIETVDTVDTGRLRVGSESAGPRLDTFGVDVPPGTDSDC